MYLKRLVLIAGILFITSAGDLLAMHDGDSEAHTEDTVGDGHQVVVIAGAASPALSAASGGSSPRASMSAGASNAGFGSGGGYTDHSQAYLSALAVQLFVIGGVAGHPFGAVKAPDACASAISNVQKVSPIIFVGVKGK